MNEIKVEIVADSINQQGGRLISIKAICDNKTLKTLLNEHKNLNITYTDIDLIETDTVIGSIETNPFIPIAWKKEYKSMQGTEYYELQGSINKRNSYWLNARDEAIKWATILQESDTTKQLCNRLLEPFMWTTMLITGSKEGWNNFFSLMMPEYHLENIPTVNEDLSLNSKTLTLIGKSKKELLKQINEIDNDSYIGFKNIVNSYSDLDWLKINKGQAEIHMMMLSEKIYDAIQESVPKKLKEGEWHIPMIEIIED